VKPVRGGVLWEVFRTWGEAAFEEQRNTAPSSSTFPLLGPEVSGWLRFAVSHHDVLPQHRFKATEPITRGRKFLKLKAK
jgi:hypothetical protein